MTSKPKLVPTSAAFALTCAARARERYPSWYLHQGVPITAFQTSRHHKTPAPGITQINIHTYTHPYAHPYLFHAWDEARTHARATAHLHISLRMVPSLHVTVERTHTSPYGTPQVGNESLVSHADNTLFLFLFLCYFFQVIFLMFVDVVDP